MVTFRATALVWHGKVPMALEGTEGGPDGSRGGGGLRL